MKIVSVVAKVLAALAAVVGAIYLLATYGEKIVAWCKEVMAKLPACPCCDDEPVVEEPAAPVEPAAPAEPVAPVVEEEDEVLDEVPVEEIPVVEANPNEVVADEADFAE